MPEQYIQLPVDSTGKKHRTLQETIGANTVQDDILSIRQGQCYMAIVSDVAPAQNKVFLGVLNGTGSGKTMRIITGYLWNNHVTNASAVNLGMRWVRITALSGGTSVSINKLDTDNAAIPSQVIAQSASTTSTEDTDPLYFWHGCRTASSHGMGGVDGAPFHLLYMTSPTVIMHDSQQKITLAEGQGIAVKQDTNTGTTGFISAIIVFELI